MNVKSMKWQNCACWIKIIECDYRDGWKVKVNNNNNNNIDDNNKNNNINNNNNNNNNNTKKTKTTCNIFSTMAHSLIAYQLVR